MLCEYPSARQVALNQVYLRPSGKLSSSRSLGQVHAPQSELNEQTTALNIADLRSLLNWTLEAYKGFGDTSEENSFWQVEVPQLACSHPFLMHSLLAISCLHLARQSMDRRGYYRKIAAEHQNKALPAYRSIVSDLARSRDEQKARAMVALAKLITIYAVLSPPTDFELSEASRVVAHTIEVFSLLRGATEVVGVLGVLGVCPMVSHARAAAGYMELSLNPEDARLAILDPLISRDLGVSPSGGDNLNQASSTALHLLRSCFAMLFRASNPVSIMWSLHLWVELIPNAYLKALSELQPEALVILAHWCIMLKWAEARWYLQGSAKNILSAVHGALNEEWRAQIVWPLQVVYDQG